MNSPFFSVIIPLYNREKTIVRAIESVLNQTFKDFELIVVDDCSTDNSGNLVQFFQLKDTRIKYIKNEINQERCISRNNGIKIAKGNYICFLDSDDYHLPIHLETFYHKILEEKEPKAFLFTSAWNETEEGLRTERICPEIRQLSLYHYFLNYTVNPQRWCVERSVANAILFDPEIVICEDLDFSLRVVHGCVSIIQIPFVTTVYVASSDSFTHGDSQKWEKELFYLKRIFSKQSLKQSLPTKDVKRLLSICYYHLASKANRAENKSKTIYFAIKSLFLYPKGYKQGIKKDLFILIIVSLPFFSFTKRLLLRR
jgi:glycosyltransferase involved in cell wall biosynthesis